jgi:hypothetical protein
MMTNMPTGHPFRRQAVLGELTHPVLYERLPNVLAGLHFIAFACLMLHRLIPVLAAHNTL